MKTRWIASLVMGAVLLLGATGCVVRSGEPEPIQEQPRIISTSAALTDILDQLQLDLVGVPTTAFALPKRYKEVTKVGPPMTPDMELIKSLRPTHVLSPNSLQYELKPQYESIQVSAIFVNLMSVQGMMKSIVQLGEKYNRMEAATKLLNDYESFMQQYNKQIEGKKRPKVLVLMGIPGSYMVATDQSYVGSLVKLAGGENVFDSKEALLNMNTEAIVQTDPDIILRASHALPDEVQKMFDKEFATNDIWKHFRAVQENRVFDLSHEQFGMSANLGYKEALNHLQQILYAQ